VLVRQRRIGAGIYESEDSRAAAGSEANRSERGRKRREECETKV